MASPKKPAGYSGSALIERKAITLLENILDSTRTVSYLKAGDRTPNIDGYIELLDIKGHPVAKVEVQVKKLNKKYTKKPKYACNEKLFAYCNNAQLPVILIVVDIGEQIAYWKNMNEGMVDAFMENNRKSATVDFDLGQYIKEGENGYYDIWLDICSQEQSIKKDGKLYRRITAEYDQSAISTMLKEFTMADLGRENNEIGEVHRFLDIYNGLLDHEFISLKELFYNSIWKQGIAYKDYTDSSLQYTKYGILFNKNDTLVKRLKQEDLNVVGPRIRFKSDLENPVKRRPRSHAYELLQWDLKRALQNNQFVLASESTTIEQIFSLADKLPFLLRVKPHQLSYTLDEIDRGINLFMGKWLDCYHATFEINDLISNVDELKEKLTFEEIEGVSKNIFSRAYPNKISAYSGFYNFRLIKELIREYKRKEIPVFKRHFQYPYQDTDDFLVLTEQIRQDFLTYYREVALTHNQFIRTYFPLLYDQLHYYLEFDKEIIRIKEFNKKGEEIKVNWSCTWVCYIDKNKINHSAIVNIEQVDEELKAPLGFHEDPRPDEIGLHNEVYMFGQGWHGDLPFKGELPITTAVRKLILDRFRYYFKTQLNNEGLSAVIL